MAQKSPGGLKVSDLGPRSCDQKSSGAEQGWLWLGSGCDKAAWIQGQGNSKRWMEPADFHEFSICLDGWKQLIPPFFFDRLSGWFAVKGHKPWPKKTPADVPRFPVVLRLSVGLVVAAWQAGEGCRPSVTKCHQVWFAFFGPTNPNCMWGFP